MYYFIFIYSYTYIPILNISRLVDLQVKEIVERSLMDCLSTGASLLLPPLSGRLNILKSLLAQDTNLTRGQVTQNNL